MKIENKNIIDFFETIIISEKLKISNLEDYLKGESIVQDSNKVDEKWGKVVFEHIKKKSKLKLVILAEAPLCPEKYFYTNQGTFLDSLRGYWGLPQNRDLPKFMIKNGVLLLDIYRFSIPSEFYKKDENLVLFENEYVSKRLDILREHNLIDNETPFVFRYKELFKKRELHNQVSLKDLNFVKEENQLISLNKSEKPQVIHDLIAEILKS